MGYLRVCQYSLYPFEVSVSLKYRTCQLQKNLGAFSVLLPKCQI